MGYKSVIIINFFIRVVCLRREKSRENLVSESSNILWLKEKMEDDDQQFESAFDEEDYGEFDDMYGDSESDQDEVIDYEDMKSALELIQNVCDWFAYKFNFSSYHSHFWL